MGDGELFASLACFRDGCGAVEDELLLRGCYGPTMTKADVDNGRLICWMGVAPAKPAEFVLVRRGQIAGGYGGESGPGAGIRTPT